MKTKRYLSATLAAALIAALPAGVFADVVEMPDGAAPAAEVQTITETPAQAPMEAEAADAEEASMADEAQEATEAAEAAEAPRYYTIVKGDTLWDITSKFLEDPFRWPKVWRQNPYIKNPHLIYPGNIVRITPNGIEILAPREGLPVVDLEPTGDRVVVLEPPPSPPPPPPPPPPKPKLKSYSMAREGFLTDAEIDASGAIMAPKEEHLLLSADDIVYVSFKDRDGIEEGDRYTVYTVGREVRHPVTKRSMGHLIDVLGSLEVTGTGKVMEANIDAAYKEIGVGARLKPYNEPVTEVEISEPGQAVDGYIVASVEGRVEIASGNIVYIDKGEGDGVATGNLMRVFRRNKTVKDPMNDKKRVELPYIDLGTLVVVDTRGKTSACVVVESLRPIRTGDQVSTLFME